MTDAQNHILREVAEKMLNIYGNNTTLQTPAGVNFFPMPQLSVDEKAAWEAAQKAYEALPRIEQIKLDLQMFPDCDLALALAAYSDSINGGDESKRPTTYRDEHLLAMDAALRASADEHR